MRITVGIGTCLLHSDDDGRTWSEAMREVPWRTEPVVHAPAGVALPSPVGWRLTHVEVGEDGRGLAAGVEPADARRETLARFLTTRDGGTTWQDELPAIGIRGRVRAGSSWPPSAVDSMAVVPEGPIAFAWEDPWIYDGARSHLALQPAGEAGWRYVRMPHACTRIARGPGPVRVLGPASMAIGGSTGAFRREEIRLDWERPAGYAGPQGLLRDATFASERDGLALAVVWHSQGLAPPIVGLARSADGGRRWSVVHTWPGPTLGDVNERHALTLALD